MATNFVKSVRKRKLFPLTSTIWCNKCILDLFVPVKPVKHNLAKTKLFPKLRVDLSDVSLHILRKCFKSFKMLQVLQVFKYRHLPFLSNGLQKFIGICIKTLDKFATRKKNYSRGNKMPFMNKSLCRAHMKRTHLRKCYLKNRSEQNRLSYVKQRNYCVSLLRKTKKDYYANLNVKDIVDNKQFWRTVKPLFSDKTKSNEKITLVEDETVTTQDEKNAELLNLF